MEYPFYGLIIKFDYIWVWIFCQKGELNVHNVIPSCYNWKVVWSGRTQNIFVAKNSHPHQVAKTLMLNCWQQQKWHAQNSLLPCLIVIDALSNFRCDRADPQHCWILWIHQALLSYKCLLWIFLILSTQS